MKRSIIFLSIVCTIAAAWTTPQSKTSPSRILSSTYQDEKSYDPTQLSNVKSNRDVATRPEAIFLASTASALPIMFTPEAAHATAAFTNNAVQSAIAAYGHYISLLGILGCITAERLTIKPNMTPEEEDFIAGADIGLGLWGALIAYTGYLRATEYEKGFAFYSHEPLFWLKIAFVGVFGAASFFNTIVIIKRSVNKRNGKFEPMGDKLAKRMIQICNAELVAIATIPLTATFMARG